LIDAIFSSPPVAGLLSFSFRLFDFDDSAFDFVAANFFWVGAGLGQNAREATNKSKGGATYCHKSFPVLV
jgi:hypothetical protein